MRGALAEFARQEVKFVMGSDPVSPWHQTLAVEEQLQLAEIAVYVDYFDNLSILKAATSWGGEVAAMTGPNNPYPDGPLGVIQEGAYADILLVQGNPQEDPTILADHANNTNLIMKDGVIYMNQL